MSDTRDPRPDQTVGYDPVKSADVAAATATPTPDQTVGYTPPPTPDSSSGSRSRSRPSFASSGTSTVTATGLRIAPEALIGPYEVLDELGKGGMGVVYRARHIHLNRVAALKMILGGARIGPEHYERFRTEAEAVAKLDHPNIVRVYDVGEHQGSPYIALELIEGGSLAKKAAGKPQSAKYAAQTVESLCRAVHAAHQQNIIHRDLKPANVLLTLDGQPKVTDFGLAKDTAQAQSGLTNAGSILGTPSYMAPEQAAGRVMDIGPATDVYALGAILYELLTGRPPFRGETAIDTIRQVLDGEAVPPRALIHTVPKDLDTICLKALQKPPHRRYASAEAMAEDLRRHLDGEPILARPIGPVERLTKWVRRRPTTAALIGTGALAAVVVVALGIYSYVAVTKRAIEAENARQAAKAAMEEGVRRMVRLDVATGSRFLDDQDDLGSVLWFAEALRIEPDGPDRERMHRIRLAAVLARCPVPAQMWVSEGLLTASGFDASGTLAITAGDDGMARVWDAATGRPAGPPLRHGAAVKFAALAPDGKHAVTCGTDGTFRIWEVATAAPVYSAPLAVQFTGLAISADGAKVAVCGAAGRVRVWELPSGKDVSRMTSAFTDRTTGIVFSPDGTKYLVGSVDGTARVYETATSQPVTPPLKHAAAVLAVAYAPDGKRVATASADGSTVVWDAATGAAMLPVPIKHGGEVTAVVFSPDGQRLATAGLDRTAQVWDAATGRPVGRPVQHNSGIQLLTFSPDGRRFVTGSDDNTVRVWDATSGDPVVPPLHGNAMPTALQFAPDGHRLLVSRRNRIVVLWELITPAEEAPAAARDATAAAKPDAVKTVTSADGRLEVTFGDGQPVRVRRAADHEAVTPPLRSGSGITTVVFSPDAKLIATGDEEGSVLVFSTADGKPVWSNPGRHASQVIAVAFSPDGSTVATGSDDTSVGLWDSVTGIAKVPPIRVGTNVIDLRFDRSGTLLYTADTAGTGRVWDAATGELIAPPFPVRADWADGLHPTAMPGDDLLDFGRVLVAQTLTAGGGIAPLDPTERREMWVKLRAKYPDRFGLSKQRVRAWELTRAAAAEKAGQWFAAGWHLDRLLGADPGDGGLLTRRAEAAARYGDWDRAARDADKAVLARPTSPAGWYQRGLARGKLGRWDQAAADLAKAVELQKDPSAAIGIAAKVALAAGDVARYRKAAKDDFDLYKDATDNRDARLAAWACCLHPDPGIDPSAVLAVAERTADTTDPFALTVYAAALVRAGKPDPACNKLRTVCDANEDRPTSWMVYALALKRAGKPALAKPWRDKAAAWLAAVPGSNRPVSWDAQAEVEILLKEFDQ
jgi:WD40 repeat protein/tetratricopeptide (TPR) repeat protein